jgi:hypothetical protein
MSLPISSRSASIRGVREGVSAGSAAHIIDMTLLTHRGVGVELGTRPVRTGVLYWPDLRRLS